MQAVLSRVHRIVVAPDAASDASLISADVSNSASPLLSSSHVEARHVSKSNVEILETVERLQFATLLGERKQAMEALQALARLYHGSEDPTTTHKPTKDEQELGQAAVPAVLAALVSDPRDTELMEAMLEFLQTIVTWVPSVAPLVLAQPAAACVAPWGMETCLKLLQDPSPWIRGPAILLVKHLQDAAPDIFAKAVLECQEGLRRLLEVVEDRRDHIRDAALAVLGNLSGQDTNVQQFLAFEDGFTRLFQIMEGEGLTETATATSSVLADCLVIVNNMVRGNVMTQTLFLELSYLETHVPKLLTLSKDDEIMAMETKKRVLQLALELVRSLVTGFHEGEALNRLEECDQARKKKHERMKIQSLVARQEALMGAIGELIACELELWTDIRLQALELLQLVTQDNGGAQMIVMNLSTWPSRRSVVSDLIRLEVQHPPAHDAAVAAAASTLLDSFFLTNEGARLSMFQQIQPMSSSSEAIDRLRSESESESPGRVLLDAFVNNAEALLVHSSNLRIVDPATLTSQLVVTWKASHRLSLLLSHSLYCQEVALRLPGAYDDAHARALPGSLLLSRCLRMLQSKNDTNKNIDPVTQSIVFQAKVAVLVVLLRWCSGCSQAVAELVSSVTNISVLIDILTVKKEPSSRQNQVETTQLRGLVALLLGSCLEHVQEDDQVSKMSITRDQVLEIINNRIGLEPFTDAFLEFQQCPAVVACTQASPTQSSREMLTSHGIYSTLGLDFDAHYLFLLYDRPFLTYYRHVAAQIQQRVIAMYVGEKNDSASTSGAPSAVSAYQDLIRMQDKQIQALQRQVQEMKKEQEDPCQNSETVESQDWRELDDLERKKATLETKVDTLTTSILDMETRLKELTMTYQELEDNYCQQEDAMAVKNNDKQPLSDQSTRLQAQIAALEAEVKTERANSTDLALENKRLCQELAEYRVEMDEKSDKLAACQEMLETVREEHGLVKKEIEELKRQFAEASLVRANNVNNNVDELVMAKVTLERRVEELEAAARVAYEKDQELLCQKIQQVDHARRASPRPSLKTVVLQNVTSDAPFQHFVTTQLEELKALRLVVDEMEIKARKEEEEEEEEAGAGNKKELVSKYESLLSKMRSKDAAIRQLEAALARSFLEKQSVEQKAKGAIKLLEDEVARLFLAKADVEKQQDERQNVNSITSTTDVEDLLILVASLEIQCVVLREQLQEETTQGTDAVAVALELARQRGAVVSI